MHISLRKESLEMKSSESEILCLMYDGNVSRTLWKLAIIKKLLTGPNSKVRAADIQTSSGVTNLLNTSLVNVGGNHWQIQKNTSTTPKGPTTQADIVRRNKRIAAHPRPQYVESTFMCIN